MDLVCGVIVGIGGGEDDIMVKWVGNMEKVDDVLDGYGEVQCELENEEGGENGCVEVEKGYGDKVIEDWDVQRGQKELKEQVMRDKRRK